MRQQDRAGQGCAVAGEFQLDVDRFAAVDELTDEFHSVALAGIDEMLAGLVTRAIECYGIGCAICGDEEHRRVLVFARVPRVLSKCRSRITGRPSSSTRAMASITPPGVSV
jgi:hypothetical protein